MTQPSLGARSEALPPFSGDDAPCIKCGHGEASIAYRDLTNPRQGTPIGLLNRTVYADLTECFSRTCTRCDYQWFEAVESAGDSGLTSDSDVAVAVRALYQAWYWDADWRNGTTIRGRDQVLHELYCAALLGETPEQYAAHHAEDDAEPAHVDWIEAI